MRRSISIRYAVRSLRRHTRRTILAVLGIGLGSAVCLFMIAFVRGEGRMMLKAAAESGTGHFRIVPAQWPEIRENDLRLPRWQRIRDMVRATEGDKLVAAHARKEGLLAFGTRVVGVEIVGVDATVEQRANRLVHRVTEGSYLTADAPGTTVVGRGV
ncbi:MAG: ABC transporter permease, partial [Sedimentisphaerales bacterium]|nr:ABC transporter permease [Sedimentisphaerales bacterium]